MLERNVWQRHVSFGIVYIQIGHLVFHGIYFFLLFVSNKHFRIYFARTASVVSRHVGMFYEKFERQQNISQISN